MNLKELKKNKNGLEKAFDIIIYQKSMLLLNDTLLFLARKIHVKNLYLISNDVNDKYFKDFHGRVFEKKIDQDGFYVKICDLTHENALLIQKYFEFTRPMLIGRQNSFGFGDRLGLANPGHIRSLEGSKCRPIFAQQSIRELTRTKRTPEEVIDAAVWAVFQEGYVEGFGSDADHLKTTDDIDLMMNAGFTMFTIDPSDYVDNSAENLTESELSARIQILPWNELNYSPEQLFTYYVENTFNISESLTLRPSYLEVIKALAKYGGAIAHIKKMYDYLKLKYPDRPFEIECSVDETESVTTPFDHFFIVNELKRLGVEFVSLAPRFVGDFEKGIDYKGDIQLFRKEYSKHLQIANYFGNYKISLHSGSDKFSVYSVIGNFKSGYVHVKTAGTSYLEALKVVAIKLPQLFREIFDFCLSIYESEKKSYHVSADLTQLKSGKDYHDQELVDLFSNNNARQVLHVAFGKVLRGTDHTGKYLYRDRIYECIRENEDLYNKLLTEHFKKHLEPFYNL